MTENVYLVSFGSHSAVIFDGNLITGGSMDETFSGLYDIHEEVARGLAHAVEAEVVEIDDPDLSDDWDWDEVLSVVMNHAEL